ncbi:macrophage mannose receptor 1-like isoform X1 [Pithys albifrons albifrons]|uniref:macrophage mannose receptor 1-like isoform X1 n=1 Tax=Pithys albifrons albifrons TaxID=3385563 RepID=UPI003A5CE550
MYGNVDPGQGKVWVPGPDQDLCPPEENPYEPLDPPSAPSSQKNVPTSPPGAPRPCPLRGSGVSLGSPRATHGWCPRGRWVLVALGVSVLLNVLLIAFGARHVSALTAALDAEKEKSLPPPTASSSFLLYNAHHARCVVATGHLLGATPCQPRSPSQRFQWLPGGRLLHSGSGLCVTATSARNLALVRLSRCQEGARLQRWQCQPGALLALQGQALHFNYGNNAQGEVMLYTGTGEWSRWVVHGTGEEACARSGCPPCSKGWVFSGNSCYFFSQSESTWAEAQKFCSALGAALLELEDSQEKEQIQALLQSPAWLGIRDEEQEGTWKRGNGSVVGPESSWWHRQEPNGGTLENCAVVGPDGNWFDFPCSGNERWVCEGDP